MPTFTPYYCWRRTDKNTMKSEFLMNINSMGCPCKPTTISAHDNAVFLDEGRMNMGHITQLETDEDVWTPFYINSPEVEKEIFHA